MEQGSEAETRPGVTIRVKCLNPACKRKFETTIATIPRQGNALLVPSMFACTSCLHAMKPLGPAFQEMMSGS